MNSRRLQRLGQTLLVLLAPTIFLGAGEPSGGCAHTAQTIPTNITVELPPPPSFMTAEAKPMPKVGDDPKVAWKRADVALDRANRKLVQSRGWYTEVRKRYSGKAAERK